MCGSPRWRDSKHVDLFARVGFYSRKPGVEAGNDQLAGNLGPAEYQHCGLDKRRAASLHSPAWRASKTDVNEPVTSCSNEQFSVGELLLPDLGDLPDQSDSVCLYLRQEWEFVKSAIPAAPRSSRRGGSAVED